VTRVAELEGQLWGLNESGRQLLERAENAEREEAAATARIAELEARLADVIAVAERERDPHADCCSDPYECWKEMQGELVAAEARIAELEKKLEASWAEHADLATRIEKATGLAERGALAGQILEALRG